MGAKRKSHGLHGSKNPCRRLPRRLSASPKLDTLSRLASSAQCGDQLALASLLQEARRVSLGICERILRNRADAEEAASNVIIRILEHLHCYCPLKGSAGSWLRGISRNEAISFLRRRRCRAAVVLLDNVHPANDCDNPAAAAELRDSIAQLERALGELRGGERRVLRLRYYDDLPLQSIAKRQKAPLPTIAARIRRSLKKLRSRLSAA